MVKVLQPVCILAPTGSGKTAALSSLVDLFANHFEVISVDSVAVYRGLDIGSAKPSLAERALVPHHLVDIRDPREIYTAADFVVDAKHAITTIQEKGKLPILVGGTMLYFSCLLEGLSQIPPIPIAVKHQVAELMRGGNDHPFALLRECDPLWADRVSVRDSQRIARGLEVFYASGTPISTFHANATRTEKINTDNLVYMPQDRSILHKKTALRFDAMLEQGLIAEVERLLCASQKMLNTSYPSMRAIGYRQVCDYLSGTLTYEDMRQKAIVATRRYIKRQLTWLRHWDVPHRAFNTMDGLRAAIENRMSQL